MPHATPTPRTLLHEARSLIADPSAWTRGTGARDKHNDPITVEHDDAVSWCASGALNCAMYRHADSLQIPVPLERARERAGQILESAICGLTLGHYTRIPLYNDATNHGCIVRAFDIAIRDADRQAAESPTTPVPGTPHPQ